MASMYMGVWPALALSTIMSRRRSEGKCSSHVRGRDARPHRIRRTRASYIAPGHRTAVASYGRGSRGSGPLCRGTSACSIKPSRMLMPPTPKRYGQISKRAGGHEGGSYGEITGSRGGESEGHQTSGSAINETAGVDEGKAAAFEAMWSRAAVRAREEHILAGIEDPLDTLYAVMPDVQVGLRDTLGMEGCGAGYEDVALGFYRDTNLKPTNWRDAMVSMKPGSGTQGLDMNSLDADDRAGRHDRGLLLDGVNSVMSGKARAPAVDTDALAEDVRALVEARRSCRRELRKRAATRVRPRYGGPAPGEHGPWRWEQLQSGSPLKQRLEAEIASFPRRLGRRERSYFFDKVVWVTGADQGLGERVAMNLAVNGARVVLSGLDIHELERVQRLCILAWMKCVNWNIRKALSEGLTRLDRVMVLPLDVRDDFILPDVACNTEELLQRPVNMVFHCEGIMLEGGLSAAGTKILTEVAALEGAMDLTKAVLPSMLDEQEGHVVVVGAARPLATEGGMFTRAAPLDASRKYWDSLSREVARDNISITLARIGILRNYMSLSGGDHGMASAIGEPSRGALDTDAASRRLLTAVARHKKKVLIAKRPLLFLPMGSGELSAQRAR